MSHIIEADWITKAGFRAVVIVTDMGHRCGYVGIPPTHPLYGADYSKPNKHLRAPFEEAAGKRGILAIVCAAGDEERATAPDIVFNVHGSITYSRGSSNYPVLSENLWWFGFDCAHAGDAPDPTFVRNDSIARVYLSHGSGEIRTLEFCVNECESLAQQLIDRIV